MYQFLLKLSNRVDSVSVCARERVKRAAVIGIFADARKQQQRMKALEEKQRSRKKKLVYDVVALYAFVYHE